MKLRVKFSVHLGFAIELWFLLGGRGHVMVFHLIGQFYGLSAEVMWEVRTNLY